MPRNRPDSARSERLEGTLRFSTRNWIFLALGVVSIAIGYSLLSAGSTVTAPILLVLGYVILIPLGVIS